MAWAISSVTGVGNVESEAQVAAAAGGPRSKVLLERAALQSVHLGQALRAGASIASGLTCDAAHHDLANLSFHRIVRREPGNDEGQGDPKKDHHEVLGDSWEQVARKNLRMHSTS